MGKNEKAVRDGSGPYKDSYRRIGEGKDVGRRQDSGERCPNPKKTANSDQNVPHKK